MGIHERRLGELPLGFLKGELLLGLVELVLHLETAFTRASSWVVPEFSSSAFKRWISASFSAAAFWASSAAFAIARA